MVQAFLAKRNAELEQPEGLDNELDQLRAQATSHLCPTQPPTSMHTIAYLCLTQLLRVIMATGDNYE